MASYKVFISFKNTDAQNRPTRESKMAEDLYYAFQRLGIRAFYSNISIKESGESSYRKAIDRALAECLVMVVVGTTYEHLTAPQVDAEIEQFRNDMLNGIKPLGKSRLFTYLEGITADQLPDGLRQYQSCSSEKDVLESVCNFLKEGSNFQNMGQADVSYRGYLDRSAPAAPKPAPIWPGAKGDSGVLFQPGTLIDGKYRILKLVGRGGMSEVYLAANEENNRTVAVKGIYSANIRDFEAVKHAIKTETELMRKLDHPSVPKIHEVIDIDDRMYLIMDFVEGTSLNQIVTEGPLDEAKTLDIGRQLADVLGYLHSQPQPVIYRDMKPANIILKPDGKIMLIDFGTARVYKEKNLEDTTCLGTRGFAAPEQYGGMGQTDARTDIYGLGVTLYNLVTGKNPSEAPYEVQPIRKIDPALSYGLEYMIDTCTKNDPNKRFQSAAEVLSAFDNMKKLGSQAHRRAICAGLATKIAEAIPLTEPWARKKRATKKSPEFAIPGNPTQPPLPQLQQPQRIESAMDTTVLSPEPMVQPKEFAIPIAPPVIHPVRPVPPPPVDFCSAPTDLLENTAVMDAPPPAAPEEEPAKPKKQKVTVRTRSAANPELNPELKETVAKLTALDPESQAIVRQLIDRLSQS